MYDGGIKVNLTKEEVEEAIELGKKNKKTLGEFLKPYRFGSTEPYGETGIVLTKFCELAMFVERYARAPSQRVMDRILNSPGLLIFFQFYGSSIDWDAIYHMRLKQGKKIIHPIRFPTRSTVSEKKIKVPPGLQRFEIRKEVRTEFPCSGLDLKAKTIIIIEKDSRKSRFEVDFSRCK